MAGVGLPSAGANWDEPQVALSTPSTRWFTEKVAAGGLGVPRGVRQPTLSDLEVLPIALLFTAKDCPAGPLSIWKERRRGWKSSRLGLCPRDSSIDRERPPTRCRGSSVEQGDQLRFEARLVSDSVVSVMDLPIFVPSNRPGDTSAWAAGLLTGVVLTLVIMNAVASLV